jgi:predicted site-specific integrase-resolvase
LSIHVLTFLDLSTSNFYAVEMEEEELLSMNEVAERLGISRVTVWKMVKNGDLPAQQNPIDKREKLVPSSAVRKLEAQGRKKTKA